MGCLRGFGFCGVVYMIRRMERWPFSRSKYFPIAMPTSPNPPLGKPKPLPAPPRPAPAAKGGEDGK